MATDKQVEAVYGKELLKKLKVVIQQKSHFTIHKKDVVAPKGVEVFGALVIIRSRG